MTKDSGLLKGTVILGFSGVVVKILSAAYRIPLTRMIGAQGMGLYTSAFNIFMPFFSLATAGITPTISRLCASKNTTEQDVRHIGRRACLYFGVVSLLLAVLRLVTGAVYADKMENPILLTGVALLCPNLIFATFEAVYKGISQGTLNMMVSAKAGVLESGAKTVIGVCSVYLAGMLIRDNPADAQLVCAFATVSLRGLICFVYMQSEFKSSYKPVAKPSFKITAKMLFSMAVPISLSALIVSLSNFADTAICLSIIKAIPDYQLTGAYPFVSFTAVEEKAIWLFGVYQGLCLSIVNLIPSLSRAVGASGLPVITKSISTADGRFIKQTDRLVRLTSAIVVPISLFVAFFSGPVITTLYGEDGARTVLASEFLKTMAPVRILSAFSFPLNSILHAVGKSNTILKILCFACAVKVALSAGMCSIGSVNVMGCIAGQMVFHTIVFLLSVNAIKSVYPVKNIFSHILYPAMLSYVILTFIRSIWQLVLYNVPVIFMTFFRGGMFMLIYLTVLIFTGFFVD